MAHMRVVQGTAARHRQSAIEAAYDHFRVDRQGNLVSGSTLDHYRYLVGPFNAPKVHTKEPTPVPHHAAPEDPGGLRAAQAPGGGDRPPPRGSGVRESEVCGLAVRGPDGLSDVMLDSLARGRVGLRVRWDAGAKGRKSRRVPIRQTPHRRVSPSRTRGTPAASLVADLV